MTRLPPVHRLPRTPPVRALGLAPFVALLAVACGAPNGRAADHSPDARVDSALPSAPPAVAPPRVQPAGATTAADTPAAAARGDERPPDEPARRGSPAVAADTLRGTVDVVGSAPAMRVVVRTGNAGETTTVTGPAAALLRRVSGTEVVVSGRGAPGGAFAATAFHVRTVEGRPARDGRLERDGDRWVIWVDDATPLALADPPAALLEHVGRRVWVVIGDDGRVGSFGVIG